jgi:hypothetical protein
MAKSHAAVEVEGVTALVAAISARTGEVQAMVGEAMVVLAMAVDMVAVVAAVAAGMADMGTVSTSHHLHTFAIAGSMLWEGKAGKSFILSIISKDHIQALFGVYRMLDKAVFCLLLQAPPAYHTLDVVSSRGALIVLLCQCAD